ncbi:hypothetical protein D0Z07_3938 [Hyphodiscus hymeniophilus]|uniref:Uncharacterized protein n=1 Tax=Hyphodiscus hymeniophilus TaxID=353542 RepID=A0A9P6VL44_9HELO|nr:hypothetical protein D0Z07_3938 [Hyphodiscus hymeniophilus]
MGKPTQPHQPGVYRDDPDRDDAASTSSAVLLGDIDYPDEELPSYTDEPNAFTTPIPGGQFPTAPDPTGPLMTWYCPAPALPFSTHDSDSTEIRTRFPDYSTNAKTLYDMICEQASYPPLYFVELNGTHTETVRNGKKETKNKVTDFVIRINITHLLTRGIGIGSETVELLPDNKRGYRGTRIPVFTPTVGISDVENMPEELRSWCESYVENPAGVKSFTLNREVVNHDTKKLQHLLRSAIAGTQYRGHLSIKFPLYHKRVVVYSPGRINEWRTTNWIRWVFYLTFLWVFAWPVLFFLTHKYEVVKAVYKYANVPTDGDGERYCWVMAENEWYMMWESAIKRAALERMVCKDRCLDDDYRIATANADARGVVQNSVPRQSTGNSFADGALGFLSEGARIAQGWNASRGWGADS